MNNPDHESFGVIGWVVLLAVLEISLTVFITLVIKYGGNLWLYVHNL